MLEFIRKQQLCLDDKLFFNALESLLQLTIGTRRKFEQMLALHLIQVNAQEFMAKEYKYRIGVAPGT